MTNYQIKVLSFKNIHRFSPGRRRHATSIEVEKDEKGQEPELKIFSRLVLSE